jgi:hypothetical protein
MSDRYYGEATMKNYTTDTMNISVPLATAWKEVFMVTLP